MELLKRILLVATLCLVTRQTAEAASIPTPAPGSGTIVAAPAANNPVQYNFTPNTVISSAQVNSNSYKIYADLNSLISYLSTCSYYTGYDIASVVSGTGVTASLSGCNATTAQQLTVGLSHGDYVTASPSSQQNVTLNVATGNFSQIYGANQTLTGALTTGGVVAQNVVVSSLLERGTTGAFPFVTTGAYNQPWHLEVWTGTTSTSGTSHTFGIPFTSATTFACYSSGHNVVAYFGFNLYAAASISIYANTGTSTGFDAFCIGY